MTKPFSPTKGYNPLSILVTLGQVSCNSVISVHYHLLDVVSYLPYNDITLSQSTQASISPNIKMRTHLTENTKCFPKIIVFFFVNPPHVGLVKSRHDHVIKM